MSSTPSAIKLYKGLSIYRVANSPYWMVRVWDRKRKKYITKTTGFLRLLKENGAPTRTRTADPLITNQMLYQLSYKGS